MTIKKTDLLAVELEVISETIVGDYRQQVLKEAAERLRDLEGIAKLYHAEASRLALINQRGKGERCKGT
jgi:hypothetical protein